MLRLFLFTPLIAFGQCQSDESVAAYGASDATWVLESIAGEPVTASSTLTFPETGQIAGKAPCNSYSGTPEAPYPWFEVTGLSATRMACPELEAEGTYFAALMAMTQSEVSGDVLILRNDQGYEMVFRSGE
ncbi:META domain-containing protein [Ruegeria jejuensis]|uniref:META domain-containing protein n=1 Tax=Ruegeria jejuensis TaxID=3233338 RepID=UPI00355C1463